MSRAVVVVVDQRRSTQSAKGVSVKLREQSLLAVVPLFLMIGLTGAGASLLLKSYEWRKGMEEQARGMAVALAEYMGTEHWSELRVGATDSVVASEVRMDRWGFLRGIRIWDNDGALVHHWPRLESVETLPTPLVPQISVSRAHADNAFAVGQLERESSDYAMIRGGAVVWAQNGDRLGWLECELEALGWAMVRDRQYRGILQLVGGILLLGVVLALLFSRLVKSDIGLLLSSAEKVGAGDYQSPSGLHVKELADLSETFAVVDSLTEENRRKFQRSLIENEIFRTSDVLVDEFQNAVMPNIDQVIAGRRVVSRLLDRMDGSRWHGVGERSNQGWYWYGAVAGTSGIEKANQALAVSSEFEAMLLRQNLPADQVLAELGPLYGLSAGWVVNWDGPGSALRVWHWSTNVAVPVVSERTSSHPNLMHDLRGDLASTLDLVWAGSSSEEPAVALADVVRFLGDANAVVGVILADAAQMS
ncbi:MAG: hypothetical protein ACN6I3_00360 [bacterium]